MTDATFKTKPNPEFYVTGGTMSRHAPSYVLRQADGDLFNGLKEGKFCYVLTSRQMGKSSLMVRAVGRLREAGFAVVVLDLTTIGQNVSPEQWYDGIQLQIGQQLNLEDELDNFWLANERLGPLQRWMTAMHKVVLKGCKKPVVIFIDEVDVVHSLSFSTSEFFAGIRAFYNQRDENSELNRLNFCLIGVTTTSDLITDVKTTPLNVGGQRIELADFTEDDTKILAENLGRDPQTSKILLKRVLYWTGGHPYLTQRFCKEVAENAEVKNEDDIDDLCERLFLSAGARDSEDNLVFVRDRMLRSEDDKIGLLTLFSQIYKEKQVPNDSLNPFTKTLSLSGITRSKSDGNLRISNRIYQNVFDEKWIEANMPDAELRRQRVQFQRKFLRLGVVALGIIIAFASIAVWGLNRKREADDLQIKLNEQEQDLKVRQKEFETQKEKFETQIASAEEKITYKEKQIKDANEAITDQKTQIQKGEEDLKLQQNETEKERAHVNEMTIQANDANQEAEENIIKANRLLYGGKIRIAQSLFSKGKKDSVLSLLSSVISDASYLDSTMYEGEYTQSGFEINYLVKLMQQSEHIYLDLNPVKLETPFEYLSFDKMTSSVDNKVAMAINLPDSKGYISILDNKAREEIHRFNYTTTDQIVFSPDGKLLATELKANKLNVLSTETWKPYISKEIDCKSPTNLTFSSDGNLLFGICDLDDKTRDNEIIVWNMQTGDLQRPSNLKNVKTIAFGSFKGKDGLFVAIKDEIKRWDIKEEKLLNFLDNSGKEVSQLVFSQDKKLLAWETRSGEVEILELSSFTLVKIDKNRASNLQIEFSADGNLFAINDGKNIKIWEPRNGQFLFSIPLDLPGRYRMAFLNNGKLLVGNGDSIISWNLSNGYEYTFLSNTEKIFNPVTFSPLDSKLIGVSKETGFVTEWDATAINKVQVWDKPLDYDFSSSTASFSLDGSVLAIGGIAKIENLAVFIVNIYDTKNKKLIFNVTTDVAFNADKLSTAKADFLSLGSVAFLPDKNRNVFAIQTILGVVELWDVSTQKQLWIKKLENFQSQSLTFSPDGSMLVAAGNEYVTKKEGYFLLRTAKAITLDTKTGNIINKLNFNILSEPLAIAFYPDMDKLLLATADKEGVIRLWNLRNLGDAENGLVNTFYGHDGAVNSITFFPNKRMISGGDDGTVRIWDIEDIVDPLLTLRTSSERILSVAVSKDGKKIAASSNSMVKIWSGK